MVISEPVIGKISQKWIWLMARRLNQPDQSFAGLVYASIFVDDLVKRFEQFSLYRSAISLRDQNMKVVARTTLAQPATARRRQPSLRRAPTGAEPVFEEWNLPKRRINPLNVQSNLRLQRSEKYGFTLLVGIPDAYVTA
ncbi:MAG: hypothetical protein IPG42_13780 [Betaproteobacteria bacterium]|nr:hypothetical protein [Betaproteobacteria bacterium]